MKINLKYPERDSTFSKTLSQIYEEEHQILVCSFENRCNALLSKQFLIGNHKSKWEHSCNPLNIMKQLEDLRLSGHIEDLPASQEGGTLVWRGNPLGSSPLLAGEK